MKHSLTVDCYTWVKESHGLFDYETNQVTTKSLVITDACKVVRLKQDIITARKDMVLDKSDEETKTLAYVSPIREQYWIYGSVQSASSEEQLWIVLRNYVGEDGRQGHKLREGDVVKMGRCKYSVRELVKAQVEGGKSADNNIENTVMEGVENNVGSSVVFVQKFEEAPRAPEQPSQTSTKKGEDKQCRICLGEDNDPSNPLIESPCACIGSVKLMHVNCLKHWLQSKVSEKRTDFAITYSWKQFECEVCKTKYPGLF